ncbi:MAG: DnaD domain protein [Dehalococcoidia bacterium]
MNKGFPLGVKNIPTPAPLFSTYLEKYESLEEVKILLKIIHSLYLKKDFPAFLYTKELLSDPIMLKIYDNEKENINEGIKNSLISLEDKGIIILIIDDENNERIFINTDQVRKHIQRQGIEKDFSYNQFGSGIVDLSSEKQNPVITLYENNIGYITPIIYESIHNALIEYEEADILDAIKIASENNVKNWKYIETILKRWLSEGKEKEVKNERYGTTRRDSEEDRSDEFYRKYVKKQKSRGKK